MRKHIVTGILLVSAQLIFLTSVSAYNPWYVGPQVGYRGGYGGGYNVGFGGGFGSAQTPYSAAAIGMSHLVRAEGQYNEQSSRAAVNYQQAQSQYIENREKAFAARQTMKRAAHAEEARKTEEAHEHLARADEYIAAHRPPPLSQSQLDPKTGEVHWPMALTSADFDDYRKSLDTLFQTRVKYGPNSDVSTQIERKTGELKDLLRTQIVKIQLNEYSEARQFLDSMAMSAR